ARGCSAALRHALEPSARGARPGEEPDGGLTELAHGLAGAAGVLGLGELERLAAETAEHARSAGSRRELSRLAARLDAAIEEGLRDLKARHARATKPFL
ncbi:MAG: Hpt domain-containing protein, partial [Holophagales bacterium]|nr:Hpt domain-containing protein [Holophagales bacterium]